MLSATRFLTPVGDLSIVHDEQHIHQSYFCEPGSLEKVNSYSSGSQSIKQIAGSISPFSRQIADELSSYFENPNHRFQLRLNPQGTSYQKSVWNSLLVIPSGRTMTYGDLANRLQSSPRAIGQACKKNPLALFIPCHRVVGKTHVGGYMGRQDALAYKIALLEHEGSPKAFFSPVDKR